MIKSELVIVRDKNNNPNIMRRYEKCLHREVDPSIEGDAVHPMFIIRGKEVDAIYLPEYLSCMIDGIPYSLPMQPPATMMDFDSVVECHRRKGDGWHCMTAVEWQFIADLIRLRESAGAESMRGNTSFGCSHLAMGEKGIHPEGRNTITLTGSGPESWFLYDNKEGIADFVGNVWKYIAGIRLVNGRYQYIKDNDAAAPDCDLSMDSKEWLDVLIDGKPLKVSVEDDEVTILATNEETGKEYGGDEWQNVGIDIDPIPDFVKALGIIPARHEGNREYFYADAEESECVPLRGGSYYNTSGGGSSALSLGGLRSNVYGNVGFFSAYYKVES